MPVCILHTSFECLDANADGHLQPGGNEPAGPVRWGRDPYTKQNTSAQEDAVVP